MRTVAISLVAAGSLGLMALVGRAIASDRMPRARHSGAVDSALSTSLSPAASRVWYGGTLTPIIVQATAAVAGKQAQPQACPPSEAN